jgi:dTDP-4-dehydrorhamnose reductase
MVFGGEGQLGQQLAEVCRQRDITAQFLSKQAADVVESGVFRQVATWRPTVLVNAAAYTKVDLAEDESDVAHKVNCKGAANMARASQRFAVPLIHLSTDYVFNGEKIGYYTETDPTDPIGVYGTSKEAGERAVRSLTERHIILRSSWLYSKYGTNFLKTMLHLAETRPRWSVVNDQIGTPTACIDLAEAIVTAAGQASKNFNVWGTYHFAGRGEGSWFDFACAIVQAQSLLTGRQPQLEPIPSSEYPTRARRPKNSRLNSELFEKVFGLAAAPWKRRVVEVVQSILAPNPSER